MAAAPLGASPADSLTSANFPARWALGTALWPWIVSRVLVAGALALAHELVSGRGVAASEAARVHQGLLGWDAGWYESIARHGYAGAGHASLRFFPLVPALARALSVLPGLGVGAALVVVANVSALGGPRCSRRWSGARAGTTSWRVGLHGSSAWRHRPS